MTTSPSILASPRRWLTQNPQLWQPKLIAAAVIFLSAVLSSIISPLQGILMLIVPCALGGVFMLLRQPHLGLLALVVMGLIANIGISDNFNPTVLLLVLLTGLWIFDIIVRRRLPDFRGVRPVRPLFLLIGTAILSVLLGQLPWFPVEGAPLQAQIGGMAVFLLSGSAFLMVAYQLTELAWLKWLVWLLIGVGAIYIIARVSPRPLRMATRFFPWGSTSCLFWTWIITHLFSQALLNQRLNAGVRLALWGLFLAALYAVLVQTFDWKSGWIPPLASIAAVVAFRWKRVAIVMGMLGLFLAPIAVVDLIAGDEYSYSTRLDAWLIMLDIIKVNPITGLGVSNYYWYTPLYAIRGYTVSFNSHNQYIDLVAQVGLVGLFFYFWFFAEVGWLGWQLRKRVAAGFSHAYVYGALGGLVGMLVAGALGDWVLPYVYNVGLVGMRSSILGWLYLGGLLMIARTVDTTVAEGSDQQLSAQAL